MLPWSAGRRPSMVPRNLPPMRNPRDNPHRTFLNGRPIGAAGPEDLERRARELALIDGRDLVTPEDRARAREELSGQFGAEALTEDEPTAGSRSRDPSDPVADRGVPAPQVEPNEEADLEHLALEGVEEAQHEQMLQSRLADEEDPDRYDSETTDKDR